MNPFSRLTFATLTVLSLAAPLYADDAEDRAIQAIEQRGGVVTRDEMNPARPVVHVALAHEGVTDSDLKELAAFKRLQVLSLNFSSVTDTGLKELADLKELKELYLGFTKVRDLKGLAVLTRLQTFISAPRQ